MKHHRTPAESLGLRDALRRKHGILDQVTGRADVVVADPMPHKVYPLLLAWRRRAALVGALHSDTWKVGVRSSGRM
eukprot:scaffold317227_cov22-Tisochrysis_lutea.AAC.1